MKDKALFIKTSNKETFETLLEEGFQLVDFTNGVWTFINDVSKPLVFDSKKMTYSDKLCF